VLVGGIPNFLEELQRGLLALVLGLLGGEEVGG